MKASKLLLLTVLASLLLASTSNAWYSSSTGRWLSRDPIGERGGVNLYAMVKNDPVNWVDCLGLDGIPYPGKSGYYYFTANSDLVGSGTPENFLDSGTGGYMGPANERQNQQCASGAQYMNGTTNTSKNGNKTNYDAPKARTWEPGDGLEAAWKKVKGPFMAASFSGNGGKTYLNTSASSGTWDHTITVLSIDDCGMITYYDQGKESPWQKHTMSLAELKQQYPGKEFKIVLSKQ